MSVELPCPEALGRLTHYLFQAWGDDFRHYKCASLARRVALTLMQHQLSNLDELLERLKDDEGLREGLRSNLSINVTAFFRDPPVFRYLQEHVFPWLATHPSIRIWSAGMASGAEPWSLSILLHEAGLAERSVIYATDFNPHMVEQAQRGEVPFKRLKEAGQSYQEAGGQGVFSQYLTRHSSGTCLDPQLRRPLVFATHNLATDGVFNHFHLILCRNVLIYFDSFLTDRALGLFADSLTERGFLTLGLKESLGSGVGHRAFEEQTSALKVYRKR